MLSTISCNSSQENTTSPKQINESPNTKQIDECELYGHSNRVDGVSGATIIIQDPRNKKEQLINDILHLPELNKLQSEITERESKDFVAVSICNITSNPFQGICIIDNYYQDSLIFKLEIDTLDMSFKILKP